MTKKLPLELKQARKPIQRACVFCHEKHLQCDVGRPCQNCIKRNRGYLCRDKVRKPRKRSSNSGDLPDKSSKESSDNDSKEEVARQMAPGANAPVIRVDLTKYEGVNEGLKKNDTLSDELPRVQSLNTLLNDPSNSFLDDPLIPNMGAPGNGNVNNLNLKRTRNVEGVPHLDFDSMWASNEYMKLNDITGMDPEDFKTDSVRDIPNETPQSPLKRSLSSHLFQYLNVGPTISKSDSRPYISLEMAKASSVAGTESKSNSDSISGASYETDITPYRLRQLIKTASDLFEKKYLIKPHNYRAAFKQLLLCLHHMFLGGYLNDDNPKSEAVSKENVQDFQSEKMILRRRQLRHITKSIVDLYMPAFVTLTSNMIEEDLLLQEMILQRTLLEYESMAKLVNCTPVCIWRRSGELLFVSNEFSSLTGFTRKEILNNNRFIVEFLDHQSVVEYYDLFHQFLAFGSKESQKNATSNGEAVFSKCKLLVNSGSFLKCTCCWSVKRDSFNISLLVMGHFLPIFDED